MNNITILVIDDEVQIRKLLQITLESNDYHTVFATNGKEGLLLAANHNPDLILLDLGLPDMSGQEVLSRFREWNTKPIIIISVQDDEAQIVKALDNGANDYLTKPFRTAELLARIRSALRNKQTTNQNQILQFGDLSIDILGRIAKVNEQIIKLTNTEYNLLLLLAKNHGRVLTHQYILKEIWGIGHQNETQYLRVFIGTLRKKIEKDPHHPDHIQSESGIGYRLV